MTPVYTNDEWIVGTSIRIQINNQWSDYSWLIIYNITVINSIITNRELYTIPFISGFFMLLTIKSFETFYNRYGFVSGFFVLNCRFSHNQHKKQLFALQCRRKETSFLELVILTEKLVFVFILVSRNTSVGLSTRTKTFFLFTFSTNQLLSPPKISIFSNPIYQLAKNILIEYQIQYHYINIYHKQHAKLISKPQKNNYQV